METTDVLTYEINETLWHEIANFNLDFPFSDYGFSLRLAKENCWTINFTASAITRHTIPGFYRSEIIPLKNESDNSEWEYFLLGNVALSVSLSAMTSNVESRRSGWSGFAGVDSSSSFTSSSGNSCGGSSGCGGSTGCGGRGAGGCGGCGGGGD